MLYPELFFKLKQIFSRLSRISGEVMAIVNITFVSYKDFDGNYSCLIRKRISWEDDIYSLQSWKGTEYNDRLVLYGKFNNSSYSETNM